MRAPAGSWAVAASVLAHGCAVALMLLRFQAEPSGAAAAGIGGIVASLGPMGGAPGGAVTSTTPVLEEVETVKPVETVEATEPVEAVETVETVEVVEAVDTPAPVEAETVPPAETVEAVEQVAEAPMVPLTEPEPPREVVPPPPAPVKPEAPRSPEPSTPPTKSLAAVAPAAEAKPDPALTPTPPPVAGAGGRSGTRSAPDAGSGEDAAGGGRPGADPGYLAVLSAWLERHKEYPRRAQLRRQEGTATLRFVIDRDGRVLSFEIVKSSGYPALDREVKEMIQRASPVPAMPDSMQRAKLELVVPVAFKLR